MPLFKRTLNDPDKTIIRLGLEAPELILPYLRVKARGCARLAARGEIGHLLAYAPTAIGIDTHTPYLRMIADDGILEREVQGSEMFLNVDDRGISHDLAVWGERESKATAAYRNVLSELSHTVGGDITVFDIGANIGYYALIASDCLGDRINLYAIEPHPGNYQYLIMNLKRNGYDATTIQAAIGDSAGTTNLQVSEVSNKHRVDGSPQGDTLSEIEVELHTVDGLAADYGIKPDEIEVLRMDVEGYESQVLEGAQGVIAAGGPLVIFIELHLGLLDEDSLAAIIELLKRADMNVREAFFDPPLRPSRRLDIKTLDELDYPIEEGIQVILSRGVPLNHRTMA